MAVPFVIIGALAASALLAEDATHQSKPSLPINAARALALNAVPGGEILSEELEDEHGSSHYEFKIQSPRGLYEVEIDATTGRVVEVESEPNS